MYLTQQCCILVSPTTTEQCGKGQCPNGKKAILWSSNQDGGLGRDPSLPPTTKRRITTNLKSINNQKCQKIKLHGTMTTTELKKISTRKTRPLRWQTTRADSEKPQTLVAGLALELGGLHRRGWLKGIQKWLWATNIAVVGEAPSLTQESIEKCARDEQSVPSLDLPPQAAQQGRKEGLPAWVNN